MSRFLSKLTVLSAQGYGLIWGGTCADWGDEQQGMHATYLPYPGGYVRSKQFAAIACGADTLSRAQGPTTMDQTFSTAAITPYSNAMCVLQLLLLQLRDSEAVT